MMAHILLQCWMVTITYPQKLIKKKKQFNRGISIFKNYPKTKMAYHVYVVYI